MPTDEKILAVIPARWASTRFPGKPIADILGKPMVQWVSERAQKANLINEVVIATDDERIYDAVLDFGGQAVMTSPNHQSGTDRVAEVVSNIECDIVVNVQGDEPLIPSENIDLVIKPLLDSGDLSASTLMIAIHSWSEMLDPNICKVVVDNVGRALYFTRAPLPYNRDHGCVDKSKIDNEGVSSIYNGAFSRFFTLTFNCSHSCFSSLPVLSFSELRPVSDEINLVISCKDDISKEKKATGMF